MVTVLPSHPSKAHSCSAGSILQVFPGRMLFPLTFCFSRVEQAKFSGHIRLFHFSISDFILSNIVHCYLIVMLSKWQHDTLLRAFIILLGFWNLLTVFIIFFSSMVTSLCIGFGNYFTQWQEKNDC